MWTPLLVILWAVVALVIVRLMIKIMHAMIQQYTIYSIVYNDKHSLIDYTCMHNKNASTDK